MKHLQCWTNANGLAALWSVIVLIALVVVLGAATYLFLPRLQAPEPEPVVVRMKIPAMPSPAQTPMAEDHQAEFSGTTATPPRNQADAVSPRPAGQTGQVAASADSDGLPARPETLRQEVVDERNRPSPEAAYEKKPPSLAAAATETTPEGSMPQSLLTDGNEPNETIPSAAIAPGPATGTQKEDASPDQMSIPSDADVTADRARPPEPPHSEEAVPPTTDNAKKPHPFSIQVGVYRSKRNADRMVSTLKAQEYPGFIHESHDKLQRPLYKVCFGRFETKRTAVQTAAAFTQKAKQPALVVRLAPR